MAEVALVCSCLTNVSNAVHFCCNVVRFCLKEDSSARSLAISANCILPSEVDGLPLLEPSLEQLEHWQVQVDGAGERGD